MKKITPFFFSFFIVGLLTGCSNIQEDADKQSNQVSNSSQNEDSEILEWTTLNHPLTQWSIKIPKLWPYLIHDENTLSFGPAIDNGMNMGEIEFSIFKNDRKLTAEEFFQKNPTYQGGNPFMDTQAKSESININGLMGQKFTQVMSKSNTGTAILLFKDDYIIKFFDISNKYQATGMFDKIINSIIFNESN